MVTSRQQLETTNKRSSESSGAKYGEPYESDLGLGHILLKKWNQEPFEARAGNYER